MPIYANHNPAHGSYAKERYFRHFVDDRVRVSNQY